MAVMMIFGLGYSGQAIARALAAQGWRVAGTGRTGGLDFADEAAVRATLAGADAVLSTVPPQDTDPVLTRYSDALAGKWLGYLSSTGVYGDARGAWVDESAPLLGRRPARNAADAAWLALGARVFRLPGIYGPGRSAFDALAAGRAHRVDVPGQVFSRIHVEDIAGGVLAALGRDAPPGAYNLADDLPAPQHAVIAHASALLGVAPPPLLPLEEVGLSPQARAFYAESRRIAQGKARRVLGWRPRYPTYREGLLALRPVSAIKNDSAHSRRG